MSFFKQFGHLASGTVTVSAAATPTAILTPGSDEFVDIYNITIATTDTTSNVVTIDDSTNVLGVYVTSSSQATVPILLSVPIRGKKGGAIRATVATITGGKFVYVTVAGLTSKT